ncbi:hypothetical protein HRTV-25_gp81 [Halorubrum tailed virus 25]|uniref:Uncharacterized protein n=1 Tax=Halorubrum tailed virus 25 TaxID=2878006 RepID=A0AAE8XYL4_9CAUD|nr:hypothetical protein M1M37_gp081 [Halorubrum tailed virus 25]UBF22662.1 hypothetical protein HRTV-25_gp81 [Halorubrum tailed virus 25]
MLDFPDLPRGFEWWSGERGRLHYTRWFGTAFRMGGSLAGKHGLGGYHGEVYWDKRGDGDHHVAIYPVLSVHEWGDPEIGEYAVSRGRYKSEQDALDAVPEIINRL